jgi:hypothetical protein
MATVDTTPNHVVVQPETRRSQLTVA